MGLLKFTLAVVAQIVQTPYPVTGTTAVAEGTGWTLEQAGQGLRLIERDRTGTAVIVRSRQRPWGTLIDGRRPDGAPVSLAIDFGICRTTGIRGGRPLRLNWQGRVLTGCYYRSVMIERPLLD